MPTPIDRSTVWPYREGKPDAFVYSRNKALREGIVLPASAEAITRSLDDGFERATHAA